MVDLSVFFLSFHLPVVGTRAVVVVVSQEDLLQEDHTMQGDHSVQELVLLVLHKQAVVPHMQVVACHKEELKPLLLLKLLLSKSFLPEWSLMEGLAHFSPRYSLGSSHLPKRTR